MTSSTFIFHGWLGLASLAAVTGATLPVTSLSAAQIDIVGPSGSVVFGHGVTVLPNGNIVVTDPQGPAGGIGAVYLYNPAGHLLSTLTGSSSGDAVGSGGNGSGVVVLASGNFVVVSPYWRNGVATNAGAVTWVDGTNGLSGVVSTANSLVGSSSADHVGLDGIVTLSNGNYVAISSSWNNGTATQSGAVTWGNGNTGLIGAVSAANSLVGTSASDAVGSAGVTVLNNGNYVVRSPSWRNGAMAGAGAATWASGTTGLTGAVSASNSLVGVAAGDQVGNSISALNNGNYVVASAFWHNGSSAGAGAVTWANGNTGSSGVVSAANSLVGTTADDNVGSFVTALTNGNFVVTSPGWHNGATVNAGAATWVNGTTGLTGAVSAGNSLVGTVAGDRIGFLSATALSNGNYVVQSPTWHNGSTNYAGAATWANGTTGLTGSPSALNSLVGSTMGDEVGSTVVALSNGNYVVASSMWTAGSIGASKMSAGAATWGNGASGLAGAVSAGNSLVGATSNDQVGTGVTALANGNYVVQSPYWHNGSASNAGAATWANGTTGLVGIVSANNSIVGTTANDGVSAGGVAALSNGNYVVTSEQWNNGVIATAGAVTWGNGNGGVAGAVSAANSFVGTKTNDRVGSSYPGETPLADGNFVIVSTYWSNGVNGSAGAVTLASGAARWAGSVQAYNSVLGTAANGGNSLVFAYDATRRRLAVGRPADNTVSLFTIDQVFADGFQ